MDEKKEFIALLFDGYKRRKEENKLYSHDISVPKIIIENYIKYIEKPSFSKFISLYKRNYILCESKVEPNFTLEEQKGLSDVYDYINDFDFNKQKINIFTTSVIIHQKLYAYCEGNSFGGDLRQTTAYLFDTYYDIPDPEVAKKIFNSYIPKGDYILDKLRNGDVFGYIDDCIKLNVDLIKLQPFSDGNKRTFRSLLNLLFKAINIPPIYIPKREREEYKRVLLKAIKENDYSDIIHFYYYKICDAIITLDIKHSKLDDEKQKRHVI